MTRPPEIFVLAGPNGAGKTTAASAILPRRFRTSRYLNADEIAKALAITSPIEAGRLMLERMHQLRDDRNTFAFETTLAGKSNSRFLVEAQRAGYRIHLAYLWLSNPELAKNRVAVRVQRGGHDVPCEDIVRRYWRGLRNFFDLYIPLANRWVLCDNSSRQPVVIARGRRKKALRVYDSIRFECIRNATQQR